MSADQENPKKIEGHSYDGIEELDNSLPSWWINGFYLTILFAAIYAFYYMIAGGQSIQKEYDHSRVEFENAQLASKKEDKPMGDDELLAYSKIAAHIQTGHEIFEAKCISCHGNKGQGGIGPNLTDDYWIHGGKLSEILTSVSKGVLEKGMPPWGPVLKQEELYSVVVYVKSLRGSKPEGAKAPQGDLVKE